MSRYILIFEVFEFISSQHFSFDHPQHLKFASECDIRENLDTNEYPNIFESKNLHERISEYIRIKKFTRTNVRIYSCTKFDTNECPNKHSHWILYEYLNIFEYSSNSYTLTYSWTNVRIYSYKKIWHERMYEFICKRKIDTNECPNKYSSPIYSIFEYIRHTLMWRSVVTIWWCPLVTNPIKYG